MEDAYALASVEVEGFRGFNSPQSLSTAADAVFLFGDQGMGKSSLLGAVEWCLFGDLAYFKSMESKTQAELVSQHHPEGRCRVRVVLEGAGGRLEIERDKEARSRSSEVRVTTPDGEFEGGEAESEIFSRLGLTHEDFFRAVHLHQESIRGLLTDRPEERDEAFDRMLGLEDARNLLSALPMPEVRKAVEKARNQRDRLQATLEGAAKTVEESLRRAEANAADAGILPEGCTPENAATVLKDIVGRLADIARESGVAPPSIDLLSGPSDVDRTIREVRKFLRECRGHLIEGAEVDNLQARKAALESFRQRLLQLRSQKEESGRRQRDWEARYGSEGDAAGRLEGIRRRLGELETQRRQTQAFARLIEDSLEYFQTYSGDRCPVCQQAIEPTNVAKHLEEAARVHLDAQSRSLSEEAARAREEERDLVRALEEWTSLAQGLRQTEGLWEDLAREIGTLGLTAGQTDLDTAILAELAAVQARLDATLGAYRSREEALQASEDALDRPKAIQHVLVAREEFERLNQTFALETGEMRAVEARLQDLIDLEQRLRVVSEAIAGVQVRRSAELVAGAASDLGRLYGMLEGHPYYSRMEIGVKPRSVAGKVRNTYVIRGVNPQEGTETSVASRYSTGQMNCAALALFLSLAKSARHKLGFLMFDDPSQSLDSQHKKALAEVIGDRLGSQQVLLATQDRELQALLLEAAQGKGRVVTYAFRSWGKDGPVVEAA